MVSSNRTYMNSIADIDLTGKKVLIRVDLNILEHGQVIDDFRIAATVDTVQYALEHAKKVILCTHNGRPNGQIIEDESLEPLIHILPKYYGKEIVFIKDYLTDAAKAQVESLPESSLILLENLRFNAGEEANDEAFGKQLASLADVYINDAFSVCHRAHASVTWPARLLPHAAGFRLLEEVKQLGRVKNHPESPFILIIGGAKIASKMGVVRHLGQKASHIIFGGAIANTVLKAKGVDVGASIHDDGEIRLAQDLLDIFSDKIVLPQDATVAKRFDQGFAVGSIRLTNINDVNDDEHILDIGPETWEVIRSILDSSNTVFWAGPIGYIEMSQTKHYSLELAKYVAHLMAFVAAGGGETVSVVHDAQVLSQFDFVSTGGGASLTFLADESMPGLAELE